MLFLALSLVLEAQKLVARNAVVSFNATTPLEDIVAHNRQAVSIIDPKAGTIAFNLLVKSFEFRIALMQEHFNENYMESDKYPKSSFNGKISNNSEINYNNDGVYKAQVEGDLTIHNVTRKIQATGSIEVKGDVVTVRSEFIVKPADYNISIPAIVENKIAKDVKVTVNGIYKPNDPS